MEVKVNTIFYHSQPGIDSWATLLPTFTWTFLSRRLTRPLFEFELQCSDHSPYRSGELAFTQSFIEWGVSLPWSSPHFHITAVQPTFPHYRGPAHISTLLWSCPHFHATHSINTNFNIIHTSTSKSSKRLLPLSFKTKISINVRYFLFPICATFRTLLILLRLISLIIWPNIKFLSI